MPALYEILRPSELAALSLLLEVSVTPKSGNVDRDHDHEDLNFQHFLISSISSLEAFRAVEEKKAGIGEGIYLAVKNSVGVCGKNVHFGSFLLLTPLILAASELTLPASPEELAGKGLEVVKKCGVEDSIYVLRAYRISGARVARAESYDLNEVREDELRKAGLKLHKWMSLAKDNVVAEELSKGYPASLKGCRQIEAMLEKGYSFNHAVVYAYHFLLSEYRDPLIVAKFGRDVAELVMELAGECLKTDSIEAFKELDRKLVSSGINPGSIADLTASSIYLVLASRKGLKL